MGPECIQMAPWTRLDQTSCRHAVLDCFSVLSLHLHPPSAVEPGHPAPPSPASIQIWTLRPSNRGSPGWRMGKQDARPDRDARQALPESDILVSGCFMSLSKGRPGLGPLPWCPAPFPCTPMPHPRQALSPLHPRGALERGCPEPEYRLCVPSGCSPAGAGTGQGVGQAQSMTVTQSLVLMPWPLAPGASEGVTLQKNLPSPTEGWGPAHLRPSPRPCAGLSAF